jgi:hypothetical protein
MAVVWTIDHAKKFVEITIDGENSQEDADRFFDAIEAGGAVPYKKLFDARNVSPKIDERIMANVAKRISNYVNQGPFAAVVDGVYFDAVAKLFLLAIGAERRAKVFRTIDEGRAWLDSIELAALGG